LGEIGAIFGLEISVGSPPLGDPIETLGLIAKDPLQHRARGPLPSLQDGLPADDLPPGLDSRHHLGVKQPNAAATTFPPPDHVP
jgi:hypothetical protein